MPVPGNALVAVALFKIAKVGLTGALQALFTGGRSIAAGLAIAYGIFASAVCWSVALMMHRGARTTDSPLVSADAENWFVNAAISSCVLLAFAGIFVLKAFELDRLVPYVDPTVVLTVVTISISVPVRMAWNSLMTLMNKAPGREILEQVMAIVDESLADLPVQERFIRVIQPGRERMVLVHVVLPADYAPGGVISLDAIRTHTYHALRKAHVATIVDIVFTADRRWGAPLSDGGYGG